MNANVGAAQQRRATIANLAGCSSLPSWVAAREAWSPNCDAVALLRTLCKEIDQRTGAPGFLEWIQQRNFPLGQLLDLFLNASRDNNGWTVDETFARFEAIFGFEEAESEALRGVNYVRARQTAHGVKLYFGSTQRTAAIRSHEDFTKRDAALFGDGNGGPLRCLVVAQARDLLDLSVTEQRMYYAFGASSVLINKAIPPGRMLLDWWRQCDPAALAALPVFAPTDTPQITVSSIGLDSEEIALPSSQMGMDVTCLPLNGLDRSNSVADVITRLQAVLEDASGSTAIICADPAIWCLVVKTVAQKVDSDEWQACFLGSTWNTAQQVDWASVAALTIPGDFFQAGEWRHKILRRHSADVLEVRFSDGVKRSTRLTGGLVAKLAYLAGASGDLRKFRDAHLAGFLLATTGRMAFRDAANWRAELVSGDAVAPAYGGSNVLALSGDATLPVWTSRNGPCTKFTLLVDPTSSFRKFGPLILLNERNLLVGSPHAAVPATVQATYEISEKHERIILRIQITSEEGSLRIWQIDRDLGARLKHDELLRAVVLRQRPDLEEWLWSSPLPTGVAVPGVVGDVASCIMTATDAAVYLGLWTQDGELAWMLLSTDAQLIAKLQPSRSTWRAHLAVDPATSLVTVARGEKIADAGAQGMDGHFLQAQVPHADIEHVAAVSLCYLALLARVEGHQPRPWWEWGPKLWSLTLDHADCGGATALLAAIGVDAAALDFSGTRSSDFVKADTMSCQDFVFDAAGLERLANWLRTSSYHGRHMWDTLRSHSCRAQAAVWQSHPPE